MREIKLRIWDKQYGSMGRVVYLKTNKNEEFLYIGYVIDGKHHTCNYQKYPIPVMQFTGLVAKNGKDIFEGDIINLWYEELFFKGGLIGYIEYNKSNATFYIQFDSCAIALAEIDMNFSEPKVIGNIYESPDFDFSQEKKDMER